MKFIYKICVKKFSMLIVQTFSCTNLCKTVKYMSLESPETLCVSEPAVSS